MNQASKIVPLRDMIELAEAVKRMRVAQAEYADHKHKPDNLLARAKGQERFVDARLAEVVALKYATGSLFTAAEVPPPVALVEAVSACCKILRDAASGQAGNRRWDAAILYVVGELEEKSLAFQEWK